MKNEIKGLKIRKWVEYFEETLENETGIKFDDEPIRKYAVGAILKNPYAGKFSQNLDLLMDCIVQSLFGYQLINTKPVLTNKTLLDIWVIKLVSLPPLSTPKENLSRYTGIVSLI